MIAFPCSGPGKPTRVWKSDKAGENRRVDWFMLRPGSPGPPKKTYTLGTACFAPKKAEARLKPATDPA